jgi:hypothetical protein
MGNHFRADGESYKAAYERLAERLSTRYTNERNQIVKLKRKLKRLETVRHAAYEYLDARANTSDTVAAAHRREGCFARLRFALLTCKRADAQG